MDQVEVDAVKTEANAVLQAEFERLSHNVKHGYETARLASLKLEYFGRGVEEMAAKAAGKHVAVPYLSLCITLNPQHNDDKHQLKLARPMDLKV